MKEEDTKKIMVLFTEIQSCPDKETAFIKGVLYGLGFCDPSKHEPNWKIIDSLISKGKDKLGWVSIEKNLYAMNKKIWKEQVDLWQLLLEEK